MSLKDLTNLTKTDAGYTYNLNGVYTFASNPYSLLYTYYLGQFLFETFHGDEAALKTFIESQYNKYASYSNPTDTEAAFVADYEHFVQN